MTSELLSYEGPFGVGYGVAAFTPTGTAGSAPERDFGEQYVQHHAVDMRERREAEDPWVELARRTLEAYVGGGAKLAHEAGLANVLVSNGHASDAVIDELVPLIDAANINLKAFDSRFYTICGGSLMRAKRTIEQLAAASGCHLEVTTLVIPSENDDPAEMDAEAAWLASLDPEIPLHATRFFPQWHMTDHGPTPVSTVYELAGVARRHLRHVFVGNC